MIDPYFKQMVHTPTYETWWLDFQGKLQDVTRHGVFFILRDLKVGRGLTLNTFSVQIAQALTFQSRFEAALACLDEAARVPQGSNLT